jgi:hypothetical protein
MTEQKDPADMQNDDVAGAPSASGSEDPTSNFVGTAEPNQLRDLLVRVRGELAVLQGRSLTPDGQEAKRLAALELQRAQLLNSLNQAETDDFLQAVTKGCSPQFEEEGNPGIKHAEALFRAWHQNERERIQPRVMELMQANMSPSGRALRTLQFIQEVLTQDALYWLKVYNEVSEGFNLPEMLAPDNLDRLRCKLAHHVGHSLLTRRAEIRRYFSAAGWMEPQPEFSRYSQVAFVVLEAADASLAVLRTQYYLRSSTSVPLTQDSAGPIRATGPESLDHLLDGKKEVDARTAATYLGKSVDHVLRLARAGKLIVTREGRPKMLSVRSLQEYLRPRS